MYIVLIFDGADGWSEYYYGASLTEALEALQILISEGVKYRLLKEP